MDIKILTQKIIDGCFDETFSLLYKSDDETVKLQRERYINSIAEFALLFPKSTDIHLFSAPGRTEIGGNHTDHQNGVVMAAAVNLDIIAVAAKTNDNIVQLKSAGFSKIDRVQLSNTNIVQSEMEHSASLIRGLAKGFENEGGSYGGFVAYTTSNVLRGSGLSSSAAFEVVVADIFNSFYNENKFSPVKLAQLSQYAENVYFGKPSGLMDQTASSVGGAITIDFKETKNPIVKKVAFDLKKHRYNLIITDTKGSHADLTCDYADIRKEVEQVAGFFSKKVLREVNEQDFYDKIDEIRKLYGDRAVVRAVHFFDDCKRAAQLCSAAENGDIEQFLQLIIEGGHSSFEYNQNAYSIKFPKEQGVPLALALSSKVLKNKGAWRLQGGGFAGTIQAFVPDNSLEEYVCLLEGVFGKDACYVLNIRNYGGIEVCEKI